MEEKKEKKEEGGGGDVGGGRRTSLRQSIHVFSVVARYDPDVRS